MPFLQRLYPIVFGVGIVTAAAAVLGGIGFALRTEQRLPHLELGVGPEVRAQLAQGDSAGALAALATAARISFGDPALIGTYLEVAEATGDTQAQVRALQLQVDLQPRNPEQRAQLIELLLGGLDVRRSAEPGYRERVERVLDQAQILARLEPDSTRSHSYLGLALLSRNAGTGDPEDARRAAAHLQRALELGSEDTGLRQGLAIATQRAGRIEPVPPAEGPAP